MKCFILSTMDYHVLFFSLLRVIYCILLFVCQSFYNKPVWSTGQKSSIVIFLFISFANQRRTNHTKSVSNDNFVWNSNFYNSQLNGSDNVTSYNNAYSTHAYLTIRKLGNFYGGCKERSLSKGREDDDMASAYTNFWGSKSVQR